MLNFCSPPPSTSAFCPVTATLTTTYLPYWGGVIPFTVAQGTTSLFIRLWGGGGAGGHYSLGGGGAYVSGYVSLLPDNGTVLNVMTGGGGKAYGNTAPSLGGAAMQHPSNFGCSGTGAGATAIGWGGAVAFAVAGAGGSGGEVRFILPAHGT